MSDHYDPDDHRWASTFHLASCSANCMSAISMGRPRVREVHHYHEVPVERVVVQQPPPESKKEYCDYCGGLFTASELTKGKCNECGAPKLINLGEKEEREAKQSWLGKLLDNAGRRKAI